MRQKTTALGIKVSARQLVCPADYSCTWKENGAHGKKMRHSGDVMKENTLTRGFFAVSDKITVKVSGHRAFVLSICLFMSHRE